MKAIATMEGNGYLHNNPGNIMDYPYYVKTKQFRLQQYPTMVDGWKALASLLSGKLYLGDPKMNFYDIFRRYCPWGQGSNNPDIYAKFVAQKLNCDPTKPAAVQIHFPK
jgi:hypothetical protein